MQATHPVVVVVADHPLTRAFLQRLLADDGYRVAIAVDGTIRAQLRTLANFVHLSLDPAIALPVQI